MFVSFMLHTGSEDACYEHMTLDKSGEDNQRIQLVIKFKPFPGLTDILLHEQC